jgi:hypothetical protein
MVIFVLPANPESACLAALTVTRPASPGKISTEPRTFESFRRAGLLT